MKSDLCWNGSAVHNADQSPDWRLCFQPSAFMFVRKSAEQILMKLSGRMGHGSDRATGKVQEHFPSLLPE